MTTLISVSGRKPDVNKAKKIVQQHEREKARTRSAKNKELQKEINKHMKEAAGYQKEKTQEIKALTASKVKLVERARKIVEKYDAKLQRVNDRISKIKARMKPAAESK